MLFWVAHQSDYLHADAGNQSNYDPEIGFQSKKRLLPFMGTLELPFIRIASGQRRGGPQIHSMPHSGRVGTVPLGQELSRLWA